MSTPRLVHIVGRKNHGKTTLVCALIERLTAQGFRVGAIKHSPHAHALDTPGTDSCRYGEAGARSWAFVAESGWAVFREDEPHPPLRDLAATSCAVCDVVIVEGGLDEPGPKLEVWRASLGTPPLALEHPGIHALVTADQPPLELPCLDAGDVDAVATTVLRLAGLAR